jgi:hypothetical protein
MIVLLAALLTAICVKGGSSDLFDGSVKKEIRIYKAQVAVLDDLLAKECPSYSLTKRRIADDHPARLQIQKELYEQLLQKLVDCRNDKAKQTTKPATKQTIPTITTEQTTTTTEKTTPTTATTPLPVPEECRKAVNYTQSWRRDHSGSDIRGGGPHNRAGYACDLHAGSSEWFRFSGAAGNRMLHSCPKCKSCGTYHPFWTDAAMPSVIGAETTVDVYGVVRTDCKSITRQAKVMRCSLDTPHELIYKQTRDFTYACNEAFCGML